MRAALLTLALACAPIQAQAPFSQPWTSGTGAWEPKDSIVAGAQVAILVNIYTTQSGKYKYPQFVAVLITMGLSALYEVYRWAEGKQPLMGNVLWAGAGAVPVSFCFKIRF